jgi:hypothetical protein
MTEQDGLLAETVDLPPELKTRLETIASSIRYDKITVSFSIGGRDMEGRKRDAFYSASTSKVSEPGYTETEACIVHSLVSKHVLSCTFLDAVRRGIMTPSEATNELKILSQSYDDRIARLLLKDASRG